MAIEIEIVNDDMMMVMVLWKWHDRLIDAWVPCLAQR
jgi:hypothetical protein